MGQAAPMDVDDQGTAPTPAAPAEQQDIMAFTKAAMAEAVAVIAKLHQEKSDTAQRYQQALADLREQKAVGATVATPAAPAGEPNAEALSAKDAQITELRLEAERATRRAAVLDADIVQIKRKAVADADEMARLRAENTTLMELRSRSQAELAARSDTNFKLTRQVEERGSANAAITKRGEFLEKERARLAGEAVELRSQLAVAAAERSSAAAAHSQLVGTLRRSAADERRRADTSEKGLAALQDELAAMQRNVEKERADAKAEAKHLVDIVTMHKEMSADAEAELKRYKSLLDTVTADKLDAGCGFGRGNTQKALDAHAEALLKELQTALDAKLAQLERQRIVVDEARDEARRTQVAYENAAREAEHARRRVRELQAENDVLAKENTDLRRKAAKLEERILLAGGIMRSNEGEELMGVRRFAAAGDS